MHVRHQHAVGSVDDGAQFIVTHWQLDHRDTAVIPRVGNRIHRLGVAQHRIDQQADISPVDHE